MLIRSIALGTAFACVVACAVVLFGPGMAAPSPSAVLSDGSESVSVTERDDERADAVAAPSADSQEGRSEAANGGENADDVVLTWENGVPYEADCVLVELPADMSIQELNARLAAYDFVETDEVADEDVALGWVQLDLKPGTAVSAAMDTLEADGAIAGAQPNFVYHVLDDNSGSAGDGAAASSVEGGASEGALGATSNSSAEASGATSNSSAEASGASDVLAASSALNATSTAWHLSAIGAYDAWENSPNTKNVTVAIIDSGCDMAHEDLKANIIAGYNVTTGSSSVTDEYGHGTHVAGIVSAVAENGVGVSGVSYNARILPVKVMRGSTANTSDILKAYDYIVKNAKRYNIRVANLSLGAAQTGLDTTDRALVRAIDRAYRTGVLSVLSGGNDDGDVPYYCFPCDFSENSVGVINVNQFYDYGLPDESSNYNVGREKTKDLSAPGTDIYSTYPDDDYETLTGSSMAAPVVSGVAALVFAKNPSLTPGEVKSVLCSSALDLVRTSGSTTSNAGFDAYTGYGLVQADVAVEYAASGYIKGKDSMRVGSSLRLSVPRSGTWTWKSDKPSVAKVDLSTGRVVGVGAGEASISATNGTTTLQRTITVYSVGMTGKTSVYVGGKTTLSAKCNPVSIWVYTSSNTGVASVNYTTGVVTGKKAGTATITATLSAFPSIQLRKTVKVSKMVNPLSVKGRTKAVTAKQVKKRGKTLTGAYAFTNKGKGTLSYARLSKGSSARLLVNKKTGAITVRKGTKKGTYKVRVKVSAAGNASYKARSRIVTVKVVVR